MTDPIPTNENPLKQGILIAFEGIDGSGKTTVAKAVSQQLKDNGYTAKYLREPTDETYGRKLRQLMVSSDPRDPQHEFNLFVLDRRDNVKKNILPLMKQGGIACIDRYYISSMAYQGALGLDPVMIKDANELFAPRPDLILYFDVPIDIALERIRKSRAEGANQFEKRDYLKKVKQLFDSMSFHQLVRIDASEPAEVVFAKVWDLISDKLLKAD